MYVYKKCYQESVCIQSDLKTRALAKRALDAYLAIHLFDEELAERQANACTSRRTG